jgi:hypothetical protein
MYQRYIDLVRDVRVKLSHVLSSSMPAIHIHRQAEYKRYFDNLKHMIKNKGIVATIAYVKLTRVTVLRYLTSQPVCEDKSLAIDNDG